MNVELRADRKARGAFYTDETVVRFLVQWGLARSPGAVLDPSCGDGRFLEAALDLGADRAVGCDVSAEALAETAKRIGAPRKDAQLLQRDFFRYEAQGDSSVDLVVGNPPFIRYQRFTGESRRLALESAQRIGVRLTKLTSAWAPFLLHALQFLRAGGAMAMVVPAEIVQTQYGVATLRALSRCFGSIQMILFSRNFFADAQTETYLLLADRRGEKSTSVVLHPLDRIDELTDFDAGASPAGGICVPLGRSGRIPFAQALLTPAEREAWQYVSTRRRVCALAELGNITNGYVTGANEFFHRTRREAVADGIPESWLRPTARNAKSLRGIEFSASDVAELEAANHAHHLLLPPDDGLFNPNPAALERLVSQGRRDGIHRRFKCRTRNPWWRVPGAHVPDVFLPYMVGREPISSVNTAGATYTNAVHGLRVLDGVDPFAVALTMCSTLSLLSMEIEGRSYGGGVLKLEPSEIERVKVVNPQNHKRASSHVDRLLRSGDYSAAVAEADRAVLSLTLKLDRRLLDTLRSARERLVDRRYRRARGK